MKTMKHATCRRSSFTRRPSRGGVAVLLVVAVLAITLALVYALSQSSSTSYTLSSHQLASLQAGSAADFAPATALSNLASDANWIPSTNPLVGKLASGEPYQVNVAITKTGSQRTVASTADVFSSLDSSKLAEQLLTINLAKQARDDHPTAAIAAFGTTVTSANGPPIYIAAGNTIRGNVRSKGPIQFQTGFTLQGYPYVMGNVSRDGTGTNGYPNYRTAWGTTYTAAALSQSGTVGTTGWLNLSNVTLGPTTTNPMGVYYYQGNVVLFDNVTINGTLVVKGDIVIVGLGVKLFALQQATDPSSNTVIKTSFPAVVVDGSMEFGCTADAVRVSGLVLASQKVYRLNSSTGSKFPVTVTTTTTTSPGNGFGYGNGNGNGNAYGLLRRLADTHNHMLTIDAIPDPFGTSDGPAIYIKGAIMASYVSLQNLAPLPFALVFDAVRTDTTDAPGFFTWKTAGWVEAN